MARTGRPRLEINRDLFEDLCGIQCTQEELSSVLHVSVDTLERWCKRTYSGQTFAEVYKKHSATGKISLRRSQLEMAKTNPAMAIWCGKQYLGQKDKAEIEFHKIDETKLSDDDLDAVISGRVPASLREREAKTSDLIH